MNNYRHRKGKPLPARRATDWECPICKFYLFASKNKCGKCQYRKGDWFCETCRIGNDPSQGNCSQCNNPRPVPVEPPALEPVAVPAPAAAAPASLLSSPDLQDSQNLSEEQFRDKVLTMLGMLERRTAKNKVNGGNATASTNPGPTQAKPPDVSFMGVASPAAATAPSPPTTEQPKAFDKEEFKMSMREYGPMVMMPTIDLRDPPGLTDAQRSNFMQRAFDAIANHDHETRVARANADASFLAHAAAAAAAATTTATTTTDAMDTDEKMCKICFDKVVAVAMVPCGHRFACKECAPAMKGKACAICRTPVNDVLVTFDS